MRTYEDFELWISADGESGYRVHAPETGVSQRVDLDVEKLVERIKGLSESFEGRGPVGPEEQDSAKAVGKALFEAIFPRSIFGRWRELRPRRGVGKRCLRITLHFERAAALAALPWELLHDEHGFLCLSEETAVVHGPEFLGSVEMPSVKPPFRVLAVLPEPLRHRRLDTTGEFLEIQKQLGKGDIVVEQLEEPSFRGLWERLKATDRPPVHAIHFAGHGEALPEYGDGRLWFQQDGRIPTGDPISGAALAPLLYDAKIRFVFINACEGGRTGTFEEPMSLAHRLLEAGVPAVLALRTSIGDRAAKEFSARFYHLLARNRSLEEALAGSRQALQPGAFGLAWASPVLYLRASTGEVFPPSGKPRRGRWVLLGATVAVIGIALCAWAGKLYYEKMIQKPPPEPRPLPMPLSALDCPSPIGLNFSFVKVPAGKFDMGAPPGRGDRKEERPVHPVHLTQDFCVGAFEVTEKQWNAVINGGSAETVRGMDLPKTGVSWDDTQTFLAKLNEREPKGKYRLLTEAEFEYATRAGGSGAYIFGDNASDLAGRANYLGDDDPFLKKAPIGFFARNRWGLYDVHGNVEEWVDDRYAPYSPNGEPEVDPKGPPTGIDRVRRGGSWNRSAKNCASWSRAHSASDYRSNDLGFRIARSPQ